MADNVQLALQTTGQTMSTEDNGAGVQLARSKIMLGAAHTDGGNVSVANPFPVSVGPNVTQAYNGLTALTPKFAFLPVTTNGANLQVVALVAAKKIRVLAYYYHGDTAAVVTFKSHTAGAISAPKSLLANQPCSRAYCAVGHFETTAGEALDISVSVTQTNAGVDVVYVEV